MNAVLEDLIVLQAQDLDLARLRGEAAEAPRRVSAAREAVKLAEARLQMAVTTLAGEDKLRRGQESDIATHKGKLQRLRRSLDGATSAAQVSAFEHEIGFAERAIAELEEAEFASLERSEALEAERGQLATEAAAQAARLESEQQRAARVVAETQQQIADIGVQREMLRGQIPEEFLTSYDRLSRTRGTGVAEALGNATQGKCAACQMAVRPQRWQDLIGRDHLDEIFTCESCGRMLFWDPRRDTPKAWEMGDRLRRAQAGSAR